MKLALIVSLLALATAGGGIAMLHGQNADLKERLAALETAAGTAEGDAGAADGAPGLRGASTRREVAELKGTADALMRRMETLEASAKEAASETAGGLADAKALADDSNFHEAVREIVLDMATNDIDFRSRVGVSERSKIPKDSPFTKVAEVLQLDASQEAAMSKDLQEIQQELFTMLAEERSDGVVPMELIAKAEEMKEGDPRRGEVFMKLFTLKAPGSEKTYMQHAIELQQAFRKKTNKYLRPQQKEMLNSVEIDWFSIKFD